MNAIALDERLKADTLPVAELPLCRVLLMNDARFPWAVLVPRIAGASEIFDLTADDQQQLWREAGALGAAMKDGFHGDKINVATLGNLVSQLHVHVVVRTRNDAAWPAPVWGHGEPRPYTQDQQTSVRDRLLAQIERLAL
ncbi:MAG: HIT family protein [Halomonas subglaciescola]|nr:HIT family protein [Halomonas subglaciescola]